MTLSRERRTPAAVLAFAAVALLVAALAFFVVACGGSPSTTSSTGGGAATTTGASGGAVQVAMVNTTYVPASITIKVGDTVTWTNQDPIQHDVVANGGQFKSQLLNKGQTFSFTFTKAGTYPYYCAIHPGMTGTVVVQ